MSSETRVSIRLFRHGTAHHHDRRPAINTMLATSGQNDILRSYFISGAGRVTSTSPTSARFRESSRQEFDQAFMNGLYE